MSTKVSLEEIDRMEPQAFERWVLNRFRYMGFEVNPTLITGDGGADGVIRDPRTGRLVLLQCKHKQIGKIGTTIIEDLIRARKTYNDPSAILLGVSNQEYLISATNKATMLAVRLIGRREIQNIDNIIIGLRTVGDT